MVKMRAAKVDKIADYIPLQKLDSGKEKGKILIVGWGSTYGAIKTGILQARAEGCDVSHVHLRHVFPFPKNLEEILNNFDKVLIPEMNNGQLIKMIRDKFLIPAIGLNKIKGLPFNSSEIKDKILELSK